MNTKYWVAFSSIEQLDSVFIQKLYSYFGDIERAFNVSERELKQIEGLSIKKAEEFLRLRDKVNPDKVFEEVERRGINVITFDDSRYPYMLSQIYNPPMVLYYKGDLLGCNLEKTVAFVGSRRASTNGKDSVRGIISDLKNTDICIVSGLAEGIDAVSHRSAIENNLKTIGVIASGFDFSYPASNKDVYEKLEHGAGAVVTEYYPTFEPIKFRFPQRNRIVTGLSYGTVVGEAAIKSGALISANLTLEQGRELVCIPGAINNKNTEGIYKLLKNGAAMVTSGEDILNTLGWEVKLHPSPLTPLPQGARGTNAPSLEYSSLLDLISIEPRGFDEIQSMTGMETEELLTTLTMMEVEGLIEHTEGDRYKKL
jgi:DNA processing protein